MTNPRRHGRDQRAHRERLSDARAATLKAIGISKAVSDRWVRSGLARWTKSPTDQALAFELTDAVAARALCVAEGSSLKIVLQELDRVRERSTVDPPRGVVFGQEFEQAETAGRIGPVTAWQWHAAGVERERTGDLMGATESYRRALLAGGPNAQIVFDLAHVLAEGGLTGAAVERYCQVLEMDPRRQDAWVNLGVVFLDRGETDRAIDALRRALDLVPGDAAAHYNLAQALDAAGGTAMAALHYRAFLQISDPAMPQADYARSRLRTLQLATASTGTPEQA